MRIFSESSSFLTARWGMCVCVGGGGARCVMIECARKGDSMKRCG